MPDYGEKGLMIPNTFEAATLTSRVGPIGYDARGGAGMAPYSPSSCTRASARALRCSADTAGKERCKSLIAEVTTSATTARVTHLWSAGTIYHGAHSVLVALRASSNAC